MAGPENLLGDHLRARRAAVRPDQVGLPAGPNRRVPGLRRAEVAMLAGISPDYYLRLEQGRDRHPSTQVLEALSRALGLDETGTAYLLGLAAEPSRSGPRPVVPEVTRKLLASLRLPAFVEDRYFDVLAVNPLAAALSPALRPGANRLRSVFLEERALYPDWADTTARIVAGFRRSVGTETHDSGYLALVRELEARSARFRELWARHDVAPDQNWTLELDHPSVGRIALNRSSLTVGDTAQSILLTVYHPDPGSDSAKALARLDPDPRAATAGSTP